MAELHPNGVRHATQCVADAMPTQANVNTSAMGLRGFCGQLPSAG